MRLQCGNMPADQKEYEMINVTLLQEVQSLILEQSEESLQAIAVILRKMSSAKQVAVPKNGMIGALKGKYSLPKDFLEKSAKLDEIIADEFYGERI